jgi:hypothetical protein
MVETNNPEFQIALREFDTKRYEKVEKLCDKMIAKNPKDDQAIALKGLNYLYLKKPKEGEDTLKQALKANFKSAVAWHFYAIFQKEVGNYAQAMKSYNKALNFAPTNYNIIRDLSYMQLYLRQLNSFVETCRKGIENKPGLLLNWISYAFGCALIKNYKTAISTLDSAENMLGNNLKKGDKHEIRIFHAMLLDFEGKHEEAMNYLIHFKNEFIDKPLVYNMIVENAIKIKKYNIGLDYCNKALNLNSDNINLICAYFNMRINEKDFEAKTYNDLLSIPEDYKYLPKMVEILSELKAKYPKNKILENLELGFSQGEEFKKLYEEYFLKQVEKSIPSFYINIQFLYELQSYKLKYIQEILDKYLDNIKKTSKVSDNLDFPSHMSWVYFYAAQHYLFLSDLEKAFNYINLALDLTPSVVEFYMLAAKILKHSYMMDKCILAYDKARLLDVGDRYLNAKMSKIYIREGDIQKTNETMKEFVEEPLSEENIKFSETLWYLNECGCCYLVKKNILRSHYCFKNIVDVFLNILKDQVDFYNFCLRRYMLKDLYHTIVYLDGMAKNKYVLFAISKLDLIYNYLKANETNKELEESFLKEFEQMKTDYSFTNYEFKTIADLVKNIEKHLYEVLLKLQKITKNSEIQYICVKYFLKNKKLLMALKSIIILSENKNNYYYIESVKLINQYLKDNEADLKDKEIILDKINKYIKDGDEKLKYKEDDKINVIRYKLYTKGLFNNPKENNDTIFDFVNNNDVKTLRKLSGETINELITYSSLYTDEDGIKEIKKKFNEKMKLVGIDEKEILKNLNFYEDKEFPVEMPNKKNENIIPSKQEA